MDALNFGKFQCERKHIMSDVVRMIMSRKVKPNVL